MAKHDALEWDCSCCRFGEQDHPCRPDGKFSKRLLASAYLRQYRFSFGPAPDEARAMELWWAWECLDELIHSIPNLALDVILVAVDLASAQEELDYLAAGPIEDLVHCNGQAVIERIAYEAGESEGFAAHSMVSGVKGTMRAISGSASSRSVTERDRVAGRESLVDFPRAPG